MAQDTGKDTKTKTKITVEDGKDVTLTGCVRALARRQLHAHERHREGRC